MKKMALSFLFIVSFVIINKTTFAQNDGHIVIVTTWYVDTPEDGSRAEYDSLSAIINEKVVSKNSKIISRYHLRHLWGSDSRQVVLITEYASMADEAAASEEGDKLFKEAFPNEEERKAFGESYRKYWNGYHSDEIYSVLTKK